MNRRALFRVLLMAVLAASMVGCASSPRHGRASLGAHLASWNYGPRRNAIVEFVERTTTPGSADFVPPAERIAVFDNDGTLLCEQPIYVQIAFAFDRVRALAPQHPEWNDQEPFKSIIAGDDKAAMQGGLKPVDEVIMATHAGMTTDEFNTLVREWFKSARHPVYKRPYNECVYQPMLEVLEYVRAHGFKTYIVSGGGTEFMRAFAEEAYGIPPEQVIGSTIATEFQMREGTPVLARLARPDFIDDRAGKPVAINRIIGRRPLMAFGNSDGDLPMLQWTAAGEGPRLVAYVHHTDGEREVAYDRESRIGRLDKGLDEASARGWVVIDMKRDWKRLFPFDR